MNKPIYEIPMDTGLSGQADRPPAGRRANAAPPGTQFGPPPGAVVAPLPSPQPSFASAPPPSVPGLRQPEPSYLDQSMAGMPYAPPAVTVTPVSQPDPFVGLGYASSPPGTSIASAPAPLANPYPAAYSSPPQLVDFGRAMPAAYAAPPAYQPPPIPVLSQPQNLTIVVDPELANADPDLLGALIDVVRSGASDLHISADSPPMVRVNGSLVPVRGSIVWNADKVQSAINSVLKDEHRETFAKNLELDLAVTLSEDSRFRVNVYQQREALGAAFRLIPTEIKSLSELGIPKRVSEFSGLARGLVLVTGPTGSGKSTTLAALIDLVNQTRAEHIVTVEDPIEFMHTNKKALINQREVGSDTHSFANALKHVLRQDPDVILIGELRDLETIGVALTAAETGHLVFATLHTQDAAQTIDRVIDVFPAHQQPQVRAQLAVTLQGVVCQTLVKRLSGGRAVATEIMITTPAISNLIREGKTFQIRSMLQSGRAQGMHTLDQHLADLVNAGEIAHQAAYDKAQNSEELRQLIQRPEPKESVQRG